MTDFAFMVCSELVQILGIRAADEKVLADCLAEAPLDSVYYHTHGHLLRHGFIGAPYPNDFATWAATQVRDRVLAERLAVVSPLDFTNLSELREELVSILDDHLANLSIIPRVVFGEPFDFMQSRLLEIPTGLVVRDLSGLRDGLLMLPPSGLYLHLVEARMRKGGRAASLIGWVRAGLGREDLAAIIEKIDPHMIGLERMRGEILRLCDEALTAEVPGNGHVA